MHLALYASCIVSIMHLMHHASFASYALGIFCFMHLMHDASYVSCILYIMHLMHHAYYASCILCIMHYIITCRAAIAAYMTILLQHYFTTKRLTLLRIELLTDITNFRAAIAANILSLITIFYYYTTLLM